MTDQNQHSSLEETPISSPPGRAKQDIVGPSPKDDSTAIPTKQPDSSRHRTRTPHQRKLPNRPMPGLKKLMVLMVSLCLIYITGGFIVVPFLLKTSLPSLVENRLNRSATIGSASFNPFTLHLTIKNAIIGAENNKQNDPVDPLLSVGRLDLDISPLALVGKGAMIRSVTGNTIYLHVSRSPQADINITTIYQKWSGKQAAFSVENLLPSLLQTDIHIINSRLTFSDQLTSTTHQVEEINIMLSGGQHGSHFTPHFSATINGSPIEIGGKTSESAAGTSQLHFSLHDINLPEYVRYIPGKPFSGIAKGRADIDLNIAFTPGGLTTKKLTIHGSGTARDIWLTGKNTKENKISTAVFNFNYDPLHSIFRFEKLSLLQPELQILHTKKGDWHIPALPETTKTAPQNTKLQIDNLTLHNGKVSMIDQEVKGGFAVTFTRLNLTVSSNVNNKKEYAFNCITSRNTHIASQGSMDTANFLALQGLVVINNLPLAALNSYFSNENKIDCTAGIITKLEAQVSLAINPDFSIKAAAQKINTSISTLQLNLNGKKILKIAELSSSNGYFSTSKPYHLGDISISGAEVDLTPTTSPFFSQPETSPSASTFSALTVQDSSLHLHNFPLQPAENYAITITSATTKQTDKGQHHVEATLLLPDMAQIALHGDLSSAPVKGNITIQVSNYPASHLLETVFQQTVPVSINQGRLNATGTISLQDKTYSGALSFLEIEGTAQNNKHSFTIPTLHTEAFISLNPLSIDFGTTMLVNPVFHSTITATEHAKTSRVAEVEHVALFSATQLKISKANWQITDETITPPLSINLQQVTGTLKDIATVPETAIKVQLKGRIDNNAKMELAGVFTPFSTSMDAHMQVKIQDYHLPLLNRYIAPIIGQKILDGTFSAAIDYLRANNFIKATNRFQIFDLKTSTKGNNKKLPTTLALLEDQTGTINLNLRLAGAINEPSFTYHNALGKELRNKVMAATVAPFSFLSAFTPDGQPPADNLLFTPGSIQVADTENSLATLAAVLQERPSLLLSLHGYADGDNDRQALTEVKEKNHQQQQLIFDQANSVIITGAYGDEEISPAPELPPPPPIAITMVTKKELLILAEKRCQAIKKILTETYQIPDKQITISPHHTVIAKQNSGRSGRRVDFSFNRKP